MALIERVTLRIWPDGPSAQAGTAIALRTRSGTPYVLTAGHLFQGQSENCPNLALANKAAVVENAGVRAIVCPTRPDFSEAKNASVDVAAVILSEGGRSALLGIAGAAIADDSVTGETDLAAACGFPDFLLEQSEGSVCLRPIIYVSRITGRDRYQRLQLLWGEARTFPESARVPHYGDDGSEFLLRCPYGISGGGLWRIRNSGQNEIWSPYAHCQLIGIAVSYMPDEQLCEPVELWRAWLNDVEAIIDAPPPSPG
jgi:hypothetical protein